MNDGIEVRGLSKAFGPRTAVEGLSFEVRPGEVFGLLGPNGAGKTTTVRMLAGLLRPSTGEAFVCGTSVHGNGSQLRSKIGLLTEQPGLYDRLTARENLRFYMKLHEVDEARGWALAESYLQRFGLRGREDEACGGFSKGMRQKLAIVRTLLHAPKVIFLDEPTSGLDPEAARSVRDAVAELAADGRTLVLCSHNLPEVERLCQRVAVVKNRLLMVSSIRELRRQGSALLIRLEKDASTLAESLSRLPFEAPVLVEGNVLKVGLDEESQAPDVIATLVAAGARIYSASRAERPLEEVYLDLIGARGGPTA